MDTAANQNIWYYIIGAGFIGFWLGMILFGQVEGGWFTWGLFGIAIAAGAYVGRLTSETVRIAIWIFVGLALGMLTVAAVVEDDPHFVATFITGVGAGLIAAGLPRPGEADGGYAPRAGYGHAPDAGFAGGAGAEPQHAPPPHHGQAGEGHQPWTPSQQQQQRVVYGEEYR